MKNKIYSFFANIYISVILGFNVIFGFALGQGGFWNQNSKYNPDVPNAKEGIISSDTAALEARVLPRIQNLINRALSLLAFIAIIILVRTGFKMLFFAQDDAEQKKGFTTVKNVAVALIFIGCSRLIVSAIFRLVGVFTK